LEAHVYDQFAELEESHFWFTGRRQIFFDLLERSLAKAQPDGNGHHKGAHEPMEILEIGCGAGGMLEPLQRYGRVTGLDYSQDAMRYCHSRGFARVVTGLGNELPFPDETFDLVALFDVIEHIPDDRQVLAEVRRVLKPDGKVFISVPAYQFLYSQNDRVVHHLRRYTAGGLSRVVREAGLKAEKVTYFNTFLFPLILAAIGVLKLKERLFGLPEGETNLHHQFSRPINAIFAGVMCSERLLLRNMEFPFGHSLIAMANRG
jgi:SAM-dependent methyltransferase